jgi:hypothetical protein
MNVKSELYASSVDCAYYASSYDLAEYDPEYEKVSIWDQFGKILDSQGNPFPLDSVTCDDDVIVKGITPKDCIDIRNMVLLFEKPETKLEFLKRIQQSENLKEILEYVRSK